MQIGKSGLQKYANEFSDHYFSELCQNSHIPNLLTYKTSVLSVQNILQFSHNNVCLEMDFQRFWFLFFQYTCEHRTSQKDHVSPSASTCVLKTLLIYVFKPWTTLFFELRTSSFFQQIHINVFCQICTLNSPFPHYPTLTENHSCLWINSLLLPSCYTQPVCSHGWSRLGSPQSVT